MELFKGDKVFFKPQIIENLNTYYSEKRFTIARHPFWLHESIIDYVIPNFTIGDKVETEGFIGTIIAINGPDAWVLREDGVRCTYETKSLKRV